MGKRLVLLTLLSTASAGDLDEKTVLAIDAEVHGEWLRAVRLYEDAIGDSVGTTLQRRRLIHVRREARRAATDLLEAIEDLDRPQWTADAAAEVLALVPNNLLAKRLLSRAEKDGVVPASKPCAIPSRSAFGRARAGARFGAAFAEGEKRIDDALAFLARIQEADGSWDCDKHGGLELYDPGVTALALLAMLARGPGADHAAADRAVTYLLEKQDANGRWSADVQHGIYCTALAAEALGEYGLLVGRQDEIRAALKKTVDTLARCQHEAGGFRYARRDEGDTSVTSRVVLAMTRARELGVEVPGSLVTRAGKFVESMLDPQFGQIGYNVKGGSPARPEGLHEKFPVEHSQSMSAAGALGLCHALPGHHGAGSAAALVRQCLPMRPCPDLYYWMEGSHCLAAVDGAVPPEWYEKLVEGVASLQREDGGVRAGGPWGRDGGVVYSTALSVLALAGAYREPRLVRPMVQFTRRGAVSVFVPGSSEGTPARILVEKGDAIKITDTGRIGPAALRGTVDARGDANRDSPGRPLVRGAPFACLLAKIGHDDKPFPPPLAEEFEADDTGPLLLLVNDRSPERNDGGWTIRIRRAAR